MTLTKFGATTAAVELHAGDLVSIEGAGFQVAGDDFADGVLAPLWSAVVTGSATVTEASAVKLDTGSTAGSRAELRSAATRGDLDVQFDLSVVYSSVRAAAVYVLGGLELRVSSSFNVTLSVEIDATGATALWLRTKVSGVLATSLALPLPDVGNRFSLRLLRASSHVYGFLGGLLVLDAPWVTDAATHAAYASNDAAAGGRLITMLSNFVRQPVVLFGTTAMTDIRYVSSSRIDGLVPSARAPGVVDVTVTSDLGAPQVAAGALTYSIASTEPLVVLNDDTIG